MVRHNKEIGLFPGTVLLMSKIRKIEIFHSYNLTKSVYTDVLIQENRGAEPLVTLTGPVSKLHFSFRKVIVTKLEHIRMIEAKGGTEQLKIEDPPEGG